MKKLESTIICVVLLAVNLPLLQGRIAGPLVLTLEGLGQGRLWQLFTHALVHVSWYHLLLDGGAFLMLMRQMDAGFARRWACAAWCGTFAMAGAIVSMPFLDSVGYCGLSGLCHGLMAVCALQMSADTQSDRSMRWAGLACLVGLLGKCIFEVATGHAFFAAMHLGSVGSPVVMSHFAGAVGGVLFWVVKARLSSKRNSNDPPFNRGVVKLKSCRRFQ